MAHSIPRVWWIRGGDPQFIVPKASWVMLTVWDDAGRSTDSVSSWHFRIDCIQRNYIFFSLLSSKTRFNSLPPHWRPDSLVNNTCLIGENLFYHGYVLNTDSASKTPKFLRNLVLDITTHPHFRGSLFTWPLCHTGQIPNGEGLKRWSQTALDSNPNSFTYWPATLSNFPKPQFLHL